LQNALQFATYKNYRKFKISLFTEDVFLYSCHFLQSNVISYSEFLTDWAHSGIVQPFHNKSKSEGHMVTTQVTIPQ